jgi:hypothetical protein
MPSSYKWFLNAIAALCLTLCLIPLAGRIVFSNSLSDAVFTIAASVRIYGDEDVDSFSIELSVAISSVLALISVRAINLIIKRPS